MKKMIKVQELNLTPEQFFLPINYNGKGFYKVGDLLHVVYELGDLDYIIDLGIYDDNKSILQIDEPLDEPLIKRDKAISESFVLELVKILTDKP